MGVLPLPFYFVSSGCVPLGSITNQRRLFQGSTGSESPYSYPVHSIYLFALCVCARARAHIYGDMHASVCMWSVDNLSDLVPSFYCGFQGFLRLSGLVAAILISEPHCWYRRGHFETSLLLIILCDNHVNSQSWQLFS